MFPKSSDEIVVTLDGSVSDKAGRKARRVLLEHGCCLVRGLFAPAELDSIRDAFARIIDLRRRQLGLPAVDRRSPNEFDKGYLELIRTDPDSRRLMQMTSMFAMPLLQFGCCERLSTLSEHLMNTQAVIASDLQSMHVSLPREASHLLPWHQDYPWVQDSEDAIVYWLPIRDLPEGNAALSVAIGSHKPGVQRLQERDGQMMGIADPSFPDRFPQRIISVHPGEVLVVQTLALHRSVQNQSDQTRWTLQFRHGNFAEPKAVRRKWPGPRPDRVPFSETHPEYYQDDAGSLADVDIAPATPVASNRHADSCH